MPPTGVRPVCALIVLFVALCVCSAREAGDQSPLDMLRGEKQRCLDQSTIKPCIMFMNDEEAFGCAQCGEDVRQDVVRDFRNRDALLSFLSPENDERRVIMLPEFLFFLTQVLTKLNDASNVAAVLVYPSDGVLESPLPYPPISSNSFSTDLADPNKRHNYYPSPTSSDIPTRNGVGKGNKFSFFPFNIFFINETAAEYIRVRNERFPAPEDPAAPSLKPDSEPRTKATSTSPRYKVQSRGQMWACPSDTEPTPVQGDAPNEESTDDPKGFPMTSKECLEKNTCLPIGGHSLWSSLEWLKPSKKGEEQEILAIAAPIDSLAFFPDYALGASAEMASLAVMMAVAEAVGKYRRSGSGKDRKMERQPVYFGFNAQSWGYTGSSRFLKDLETFECGDDNDPRDFVGGCKDPFMPSLKFLDFREAQFTLLNIGQMTFPIMKEVAVEDKEINTYFLHGGKTTELEDKLRESFEKGAGEGLFLKDGNRTLIPIDASQSFQRYRPNATEITVANYNDEFRNQYYHSMYDNATLIGEKQLEKLKVVADAIARAVIAYAFVDNDAKVSTDLNVISQVIMCMTGEKWTECELAEEYTGKAFYDENANSVIHGNYPGSFFPVTRLADRNPSGFAKISFLKTFLAYHNREEVEEKEKSCKISSDCEDFIETVNKRIDPDSHSDLRVAFCARNICVVSDTYTHNAFGPNLDANNSAQSSFKYSSASSRQDTADATPSVEGDWTESVWDDNIGVCAFVEDTPLYGGLIFGAGVAVLVVSMAVTFWFDRVMFKKLPVADPYPRWVPGTEPSV